MKRLIIDAILYPIYSWQGTWSHVHVLSSNQISTIFSAVVHNEINVHLKYTLLTVYITDWWQKSKSASLDHNDVTLFLSEDRFIF
jgi:hypothetical protein